MRFISGTVLSLVLVMSFLTAGYSTRPATASVDTTNPFFSESALPFHAPAFDKIKDSDYQPAIEEGMKEELVEFEKIANNPAPPTFANTLEEMERAGGLLTRVTKVFTNMTAANTNDTLQKIKAEEAP